MTDKTDFNTDTPHISTIEGDVMFSADFDSERMFPDVRSLMEHIVDNQNFGDLFEHPDQAPEDVLDFVDVLDRCGLATVLCIDATAVEGWLLEHAHLELDEDANAHHNIYDDSVDAIDEFIKALNSKRRYYRSAGRRCHVTVQDVRDMWAKNQEENET